MVKRAITLGGGGPAAGLHIGVLDALATAGIEFDVWSLSCIGAWVGIVYNQFDDKVENEDRAKLTHEFFKAHVFRDDESYERFPINSVFGTDWFSNTKFLMKYVSHPKNYAAVWQPHAMMNAFAETMSMFSDPRKKWDEGDINGWILNQVMAPNPFVRNMMSMMYLSEVNGLSRINYPKSEFMKRINFEHLNHVKPHIFHNAWNLDKQELALFSNRLMNVANKKYTYKGPIDASTLCACSALPFIEGTVEIDQVTYCEGALVDTVNFDSLLEEHPDLDEIWVSRIVDSKQIQKPKNLHDSLANLCQLFAATVGEDDVKLFKYHIRCDKKSKEEEERTKGLKVVEIHVPGHINFKWNHSNLDNGCKLGKVAAAQAIKAYRGHEGGPPHNGPHFINETPGGPDWQAVCDCHAKLKRADP
jgi:predicted acylesterase/phospholipase RssA